MTGRWGSCHICEKHFGPPGSQGVGHVCEKCLAEIKELKAKLARIYGAITGLSQWRFERAAELHDSTSWGKAVGKWCLETVKGEAQ